MGFNDRGTITREEIRILAIGEYEVGIQKAFVRIVRRVWQYISQNFKLLAG